MQRDLFGNIVGQSNSYTDLIGVEHSTLERLQAAWAETESVHFHLDYPPNFTLKTTQPLTKITQALQSDEEPSPGENSPVISANRNSAIYRLFNYHTKVPPEIATAFIETYSLPGHLIFDPFCGSGMLGLGAHLNLPIELRRYAFLSDLSPAAAHLAWAYNSKPNKILLQAAYTKIVTALKRRIGHLYGMNKPGENTRHPWSYQVWSDIVSCPECQKEQAFIAIERNTDHCTTEGCNTPFSWLTWQRVTVEVNDPILEKKRTMVKEELIHTYLHRNGVYNEVANQETEKKALTETLILLRTLNVPLYELPRGQNLRQPMTSHHLTHIHQFYTLRNLAVLAVMLEEVEKADPHVRHVLRQVFLSLHTRGSIRNRHLQEYGHRHVGVQSGTLYVPPVREEINLIEAFQRRAKAAVNSLSDDSKDISPVVVRVESATRLLHLPDESMDYGLSDPPFGANINYSDLNFIGESWIGTFTDIENEAIMNKTQGKDLEDYGNLMFDSFKQMFRVLKPGRFQTIIFQNSDNNIWNEIHKGLIEAGFVTHDVVIVDKGKGTIKALSSDHGTGQDIAITMRKPKTGENEDIRSRTIEHDDVWAYLDETMEDVPTDLPIRDESGLLTPRHIHALYPMMLRFYLSKDIDVPYTVADFLVELEKRYNIVDGVVIGGVN
jgi:DNA modification methylase